MSRPKLRPPNPPPVEDMAVTEPAHLPFLIASEAPKLRRFATAWLGDVSEAERLVGATLRRAVAEREHLTGGSSLRAHLFWYLRQEREAESEQDATDRPRFSSRGRTEDMLAHLSPVDQPEARKLMAGLARLGEIERQVVLLVDLEGLSYLEVGSVLAMPLGQVMAHLVEGRESLRLLLAAAEPAPAAAR